MSVSSLRRDSAAVAEEEQLGELAERHVFEGDGSGDFLVGGAAEALGLGWLDAGDGDLRKGRTGKHL